MIFARTATPKVLRPGNTKIVLAAVVEAATAS
jgi:hypothetical protein